MNPIIATTKSAFKKQLESQPFAQLGDLVYQFLYQQIITMKLLPDTKINEAQIAKELEISRSPVHTAVNRLIDEQLMRKEEGKYPFVTPIAPIDCLRISQARICIEGDASYLAALTISEADLKKMRDLAVHYEKITQDPELPGFELCDHEFHSTIVYACGNPYLIEMYECIQPRILRYRYYLRHKLTSHALQTTLKETVKSHAAICFALEKGFPSIVKDEVSRHSDTMRDVFAKW